MTDQTTVCPECGRDRGNREPHRPTCSRPPVFTFVGDLIKFASERQRYRVRAANKRYAICTKPMNALKTTIYTIVDFEQNIRGRENLIFGMGFETDEQCEAALMRLAAGETEVSHRYRVELDIEKITR
jgi:hypothetical protein